MRIDSKNLDDGKGEYPYMMFHSFAIPPYAEFKVLESQNLTVGKFKAVRRTVIFDTSACMKKHQLQEIASKACQSSTIAKTFDMFSGEAKFFENIPEDTIFGLTIIFDKNDALDFDLLLDKIISTVTAK